MMHDPDGVMHAAVAVMRGAAFAMCVATVVM